MQRKIIFLIITICVSINLFAGEGSNIFDELYIKSGMKKQLKELPLVIKAQFESALQQQQSLNNVDPKTNKLIVELLVESFSSPDIEDGIKKYLSTSMSKIEVQQILAWLNSGIGKTITEMEEKASSAEGYASMTAYAETLSTIPPSKKYLDQIEALAKNIKAVESAVDMTMNMQMAMTLAVASSQPNFTPDVMKMIAQQLELSRDDLTTAVSRHVVVSLLFTYRDLPEKDLQAYIDFNASGVGTKYTSTTNSGLNKVFMDASQQFGAAMVRALEQQAKSSRT